MSEIKIISRPVIPDRIQVNVTPDYMYSQNEKYADYKDLIIANCKLKNLTHKQWSKKDNFYYMIDVPSDIPYVTNIRVNAIHPYSVSFKINFIRYLREKIKDLPCFNKEYDKKILLDEDNYVDNIIWKQWDTNLISNLYNRLNDLCLQIADSSLYYIMPYHDLEYKNVTVSQIETNIDYNVGNNNSLFAINSLLQIFSTIQGKNFRKKINEIAIKNRIPFETYNSATTIDKNESVSIQFQICKGLFIKIYRKTTDHIRAELLFEKPYLKTKFKETIKGINKNKTISNTNIKRIILPVLEFSKSFFKNLDLIIYIEDVLKQPTNLTVIDYINPVYEFLSLFQPEYNKILCCIENNHPIYDDKTKDIIKRNVKLARLFKRIYLGNKGYAYIYRGQPIYNSSNKVLTRNEQLLPMREDPISEKKFPVKRRYYWEINHDTRRRNQLYEKLDYRKKIVPSWISGKI